MIGRKIAYQPQYTGGVGGSVALGGPSLGQDKDEAQALVNLILDEAENLPEAQRDQFQRELERCLDVLDIESENPTKFVLGLKCLYELFQDVKRAVRDLEAGKDISVVKPPPPPSPPAAFPYVPVALATVAGGILVYFATRA